MKFSLPFIPNEAVKKIYFHLSPMRVFRAGTEENQGKKNFVFLRSNCAVTEISFP